MKNFKLVKLEIKVKRTIIYYSPRYNSCENFAIVVSFIIPLTSSLKHFKAKPRGHVILSTSLFYYFIFWPHPVGCGI